MPLLNAAADRAKKKSHEKSRIRLIIVVMVTVLVFSELVKVYDKNDYFNHPSDEKVNEQA